MASEYTEQDRANEGCCWTWQRDQCPGAGCRCVCHMSGEPVRTTYFDLLKEIEGYRQRSRDEDTARIRLNHARIEAEERAAKAKAERDDALARLAAAEAALSPCAMALEYRDGVTCREERDSGVCLNHRVIEGLRVHAATADRLEIENRALRRQVLATYRIVHEGLHGGKPTDPGHQEACEMPSCRNARAALAGSREQAGEGA